MTLGELKARLGRAAGGRWLPLKWGAVVAAAVLALHALGAFDALEPMFTDMHFAVRGGLEPSDQVVVVGIGRQCTRPDKLGPWPWPRSAHGRLIDRLAAAGARAICFDMYFPAPSADPEEDRRMADAARRAGNVALAVYSAPSLDERAPRHGPLIEVQRRDLTGSIDILTEATAQGHINVRRDRDGIVRSAPVGLRCGAGRYYQLGLLGAARWLGVQPDEIWQEPGGLRVGDLLVPVNRSGDLLVNYYRLPERTRLYFVSDLLDDRLDDRALRAAFEGKVVFVGQVIHGLQNADTVATPERDRFGVYLQATIADNILTGRMLRRASPLLQALLTIAVSMACAWRLFARRVLGKVFWSAVFALAAVLVTHAFFAHLHVLIDLTPSLAVVVVGNLYGALVLGILKADREVERRDRELQAVLEATRLSAESEGGAIPERIVASIGRALGARGCCLFLAHDGELELAASDGFAGALAAEDAAAASRDANRWVAEHRRPFHFDGAAAGPPTILDRRIDTAVLVPLTSHGQLYGILGLYNKQPSDIAPGHGFTEQDLRLLSLLTQQAAMTLERASLADHLAAAIADLEAAQQQLIESERLSAVGRMANMVIHDIKNPMQGIRMFAEMAADTDLSAEDRREFSETMCREIDRLVGMCQEILDFARGTTRLAAGEVTLDDFVIETVAALAVELEQHHVEVRTDLRHGGALRLDAGRMRRVLLNLCRNAIEAMPDGGALSLTTARTDGGGVRIQVADTGSGIPQEIRDSLFEPFVTHGKDHGTGLGLAIVKKAVEDHGGAVDVETADGEGTTFTLRLPAAPPAGVAIAAGPGRTAAAAPAPEHDAAAV